MTIAGPDVFDPASFSTCCWIVPEVAGDVDSTVDSVLSPVTVAVDTLGSDGLTDPSEKSSSSLPDCSWVGSVPGMVTAGAVFRSTDSLSWTTGMGTFGSVGSLSCTCVTSVCSTLSFLTVKKKEKTKLPSLSH